MAKPVAPNYTDLATQQAELSKQAAVGRSDLNRYSQFGPEGSSNVWGVDPTTGAATNTTSMGSRPQAMYDALMGNTQGNMASFQNQYWAGGAGGGGGTGPGGGYSMPALDTGDSPVGQGIQSDLDYSKLTAMPGEDIGKARQEAQDALYGRSAGYLDPQWQESERSQRTMLANQGLTPGTPAYDRAYANLARSKEQAYTGARQDAIAGGGAEAERAQAMALQLRNQGVTEANNLGGFHNAAQAQGAGQYLTRRGQDASLQGTLAGVNAQSASAAANNALATRQQQFNELMRSGEAANSFLPKFTTSQGNVGEYGAPDVYGAAKDTYQNELDAYNAKQKKKGGMLGALGGVAGAAIGTYLLPGIGTTAGAQLGSSLGSSFSDERLKTNVERVGKTPGGFNVYDYDIFGHRDRGVMAQEVKKFLPEAVHKDRSSGFLKVDYSKVR